MSEAGSPTVEQMRAESNEGSGGEDDEYEQAGDGRESEGSEKQEIAEQSDDEGKKPASSYRISKKKSADGSGEGSSSKKQKTTAAPAAPAEEEEEEDEEEGEEEEDLKESKYVVQHGAHREYRVRNKFILHEAKRAMVVRDGLHIGQMLGSRSGKIWDGLKWYHVTILGGTLTTTGKFESCPYVCFKPVQEGVESDDEVWLRPIPAKVMEHWQPLWKEEIKEKYKQDPDRAKRFINKDAPGGYKMVLKWEDSMISGPKLEVQQLGIGKRGMVPLKEKLKSIREYPETKPKGGGKAAAPAAAQPKIAAGLAMRGKAIASSSADNESEQSDLTAVPQAHTVKIGPAATTKTFEADGVLYATFLA